jgi:hypothetical protein
LLNLLYENNFYLAIAHFSPTRTNTMGDMLYVMKLDTRIKGPWTDKDPEPIPIPRQLRHITKLFPFQQEIIDRSKYCWGGIYDRRINVVYCPEGATGKSTLALYCKVYDILSCRIIPCITNSFLDLNQCVLSQPTGQLYFVDMPRAFKYKKLLNEFVAFLELLKTGGPIFDTRYCYKEKIIDTPQIWCFTNNLFDNSLLSNDRMMIYTINSDRELVLYPSGNPNTEVIPYPVEEQDEEEEIPQEEEEEIVENESPQHENSIETIEIC